MQTLQQTDFTTAASSGPNADGDIHLVDLAGKDIADEEFADLYRNHGALIFRNGAKTDEGFANFSGRFGHNWLPYLLPGRDTVIEDKVVQTVARGTHRQDAHSELCHSPIQPYMAWFYCARPASHGGCTLLWDGVALAEAFSPKIRRFFEGRQFRYRTSMNMAEAIHVYNAKNEAGLRDKITQSGWDDIFTISDGWVSLDYRVPAVPIHEPSGKPVFVNQLILNAIHTPAYLKFMQVMDANALTRQLHKVLNPIFLRLPQRMWATGPGQGVTFFPCMEDGSTVPQSIVQEIDALIQTYEIAVQWQTNDMLVFDNTRFMHGRQGGFDEGRRILTRFGFPRN